MGFGTASRQNALFAFALIGVGATIYGVGYPATPEDLRGMTAMKCSGALVRVNRGADQPAVLLTNGRCATSAVIEADDAISDVPYDRGEVSLFLGGDIPEAVSPNRVLYATRTGTDIALIELKSSYRELEARGAKVYEISGIDAKPGTDIQLVSGLQKEKQLCGISHSVAALVEDVWTTSDTYAMKDPCPTSADWAGSPMIDPTTMKIVGILNSMNASGELCTLGNPCEVVAGNRFAFSGRTYGQRTSPIRDCLTASGEIDLNRTACTLTKPRPHN